MFVRKQTLIEANHESLFLWGARQTGKSTLLKTLFPNALFFDLLLSDIFVRYKKNPSQFRELIIAKESKLVIVDEVQKIPELLDEIHWLIENQKVKFILSGSSPRRIIRSGANLLGGRALRFELYPLIQSEIPNFDLIRAMNNGLLPRHYLSNNAKQLIEAYIGSYLRDEIVAEAKIRNFNAFSNFLEAAAFSNGEIISYTNIATDCGVSSPTIKEYFQILEDTLIGRMIPSFQKKPKRRIIHAPKFYFFDLGIANFLLKRTKIEKGSKEFGSSFEHFIYLETYAHSKYSRLNYTISYWRTTSQIEVDFVLGNHEVAIEVKATDNVQEKHTKGLREFSKDYQVRKLIIVSNDPHERKMGDIHIIPWEVYLEMLWNGLII
jgi:predicted AAA+ superfamily ATPase